MKVQRLFLDVIDSHGQLTTMTLTTASSFGDTTSIKSIFQAGGHAVNIVAFHPHPILPLVATMDAENRLLLWKRDLATLKQFEAGFFKKL